VADKAESSHNPNKRTQTAFWPWQNSLQYRILFAYGAVFVATLILLVIWIGDAVYRADLEAGEHELEVTAVLAANALEDPLSGYIAEFEKHEDEERTEQDKLDDNSEEDEGQDPAPGKVAAAAGGTAGQPLFPRLQQVADRYASNASTRVSIYATSGDALADSHFDPITIPNQAAQPELRAALLSNVGSAIRNSADDATPSIFAAAPIRQADHLLGFVQVSKPVSAVTADARTVLLRLALAALAALAMATLLAVWIGRRLVQPLRRLEEAAFAVAEGDLSQTVPVTSNDEVGALGRAFNYMVAQVRTTLDQQRAFVANASHELRTPLTNIKLRSEALRALGATEPVLEARYLAEIESEADRLTRLADDLLDLTRLEEGAWHQAREPIDVRPVLQEVTEIMQLRAEQAGLTLERGLDAPLPKLRVSADDLETVTVNLLDNAVKYTPRGGTVQLRAAEGDGSVEIRVEDNGPGIPSEDVPYIFDRFYRVDKARSRRKSGGGDASSGSGTGLGLAIVRRLVELNGGQIRVEPAPGRGTVFVVSFPAVA
jgi:signal transduction histidine kinase